MILKIGFEDFINLVNQKVSGRETDYEYGQIFYFFKHYNKVIGCDVIDGSIYNFYYGDSVWRFMTEITDEDFKRFYGNFEDFQMKYKPIEILNIKNSIRLKVVE